MQEEHRDILAPMVIIVHLDYHGRFAQLLLFSAMIDLTSETLSPDNIQGFQGNTFTHQARVKDFHAHKAAQIVYPSDGCLEVYTEHSVIIAANSLVFLPSNMPHKVKNNKQVTIHLLHFDPDIFDVPTVPVVAGMTNLLKELIMKAASLSQKASSGVFTTGKNTPLLQLILQELQYVRSMPCMMIEIPVEKRLVKAVNFMEAHLDKKYHAGVIASACGLSTRHLTRLFREETGVSFSLWRQRFKLMHAINLLQKNKSTTLTAQQLGFSSDSSFIHFFKKISGRTPSFFTGKHK